MGMHGLGLTTSPAVVRAFDLNGFRTIADLGAAPDTWSSPVRNVAEPARDRVRPGEGGAMAEEFIAASPARDRLSVCAGDFFTDQLPAADLYALGRILHDWGEENIRLLLRRICDALPSGGALLVRRS